MVPLDQSRPLRWLFLDFNSYFASAEQVQHPELRDRPIAVAPTPGPSATIIAASYPAKAFGVRTGTKVGDALRICPDIKIVPATPSLYVHLHQEVLKAVDQVLPVDKVCSIDEMRFRLLGDEMAREHALDLGRRVKRAIAEQVSPILTSSVGISCNAWLAKLATEFEKPNGLVVIEARELPDRLRGMKLTEFTGINRKMEARLMASGIFRSDDLIDRNPQELARAFGSVIGERWWYLLRGYDLDFTNETGKSLGHSHVLPPQHRTDQGCREILQRLTHKATARLRSEGLWATRVSVSVSGKEKSWHSEFHIPTTQDTLAIWDRVLEVWQRRDFRMPLKVGITFTGLQKVEAITPSLFDEPEQDRSKLMPAVDAMNQKFGKNSVYIAGLHKAKDAASEKIAFQKTWLFSEGKGDHEWVNTRNADVFPKPESDD